MSHPYIGRRCRANDATGYIRFVGSTKFAPGTWIGVELDNAEGKNDGSLQDERYFSCEPRHGVFVRAAKLSFLEADPKMEDNISSIESLKDVTTFKVPLLPRENLPKTPSRLSRPISRASISSMAQTKVADESQIDSSERDYSQTSQTQTPSDFVSEMARQPGSPRPGMEIRSRSSARASPMLRRSISSTSRTTINSESTPKTSIDHVAKSRKSAVSTSSVFPGNTLCNISPRIPDLTRSESPSIGSKLANAELGEGLNSTHSKPSSSQGPSISADDNSKRNTEEPDALQRMAAKISHLEAQRQDDVRRLSVLGALEAEKQAWVNIKTKLRDKLQAQQVDIKALRDRVRILEQELTIASAVKTRNEDCLDANTSDTLEMAMLDREVAEEQRDQLRADLREVQARNEELVLEIEILKESEALTQIQTEEISKTDHRSIELQNERLREALLRLKQVTNDQDKALSASIGDQENLRSANTDLISQLRLATCKLNDMAALVDDLKEQIDLHIGAEEMLESLTERNLYLGEQVESYKTEIADLETLRNLNDELDEDHTIVVKELQTEVSQHVETINEQRARIEAADETITEYANTVKKFQNLILTLQAQNSQMKQQGQKADMETEKLSSQATDLLSRNVELERQERKVNASIIDQDLGRINIGIALEHVTILEHYLPKDYENDKTAVEAYLSLRKMSSLLQVVYKLSARNTQECRREESAFDLTTLLMVLEVRYSSETLIAAVQASNVDDFLSLGRSLTSVEQCISLLQDHITTMIPVFEDQSALENHLKHITSFVNGMREQFSSVAARSSVSVLTIILEYMQVFQQTIDLVSQKSSVQPDQDLDSSNQQEIYQESYAKVIASIKVQCRQLIRFIEEDKIEFSDAAPDMMLQLFALSNSLRRNLLPQTGTITEVWVFLLHDIQKALSTLNQDIEHSISDLSRLGKKRTENGMSFPWTVRGTLLQHGNDMETEKREIFKASQQEVVSLVRDLHNLEKSYEEEKVRSQALSRRLGEYMDASRKLQETEHEASILREGQHDFLNTIATLNTQIAQLKEEDQSQRAQNSDPQVFDRGGDVSSGQDIRTEEIRILRGTVRHLSKELSHSRSSDKENLGFLSRPLFTAEPITKPLFANEYYQAIREFSDNVRVVDFDKTPPAQTKWTATSKKCGYIHYSQEEQYAKLVVMGRDLVNRVQGA